LENLNVDGKITLNCFSKKELINFAPDREKSRALVNAVMNLRIP
jgi:hypothetical protein